nr:fimbria/pilus periplasmic chaperone [Pseudomonas sp. 58(2021)]
MRIIAANTQNLPNHKESLLFVNVKAILAVGTNQKNHNVLQIARKTTIKLFYRPTELKGVF